MAKKETATNEGNVIISEWKMIHKPENVTKDTLFVIAACACGSVITGLVGVGMNALMSFLFHV